MDNCRDKNVFRNRALIAAIGFFVLTPGKNYVLFHWDTDLLKNRPGALCAFLHQFCVVHSGVACPPPR